jgi:hypothetical protein
MARVASRPNRSLSPGTDASVAGTIGSCPRIAATRASEGSPPGPKGRPASTPISLSAGRTGDQDVIFAAVLTIAPVRDLRVMSRISTIWDVNPVAPENPRFWPLTSTFTRPTVLACDDEENAKFEVCRDFVGMDLQVRRDRDAQRKAFAMPRRTPLLREECLGKTSRCSRMQAFVTPPII